MKWSPPKIGKPLAVLSVTAGLCIICNVAGASTASAKTAKSRPLHAIQLCRSEVRAEFISKNKRRAFLIASEKWRLAAASRYGVRFSTWSNARLKQIIMRRDGIEQSWKVIRAGRPCAAPTMTRR